MPGLTPGCASRVRALLWHMQMPIEQACHVALQIAPAKAVPWRPVPEAEGLARAPQALAEAAPAAGLLGRINILSLPAAQGPGGSRGEGEGEAAISLPLSVLFRAASPGASKGAALPTPGSSHGAVSAVGYSPVEYAEARSFFLSLDPCQRWAAYVAGNLLVLARERPSLFEAAWGTAASALRSAGLQGVGGEPRALGVEVDNPVEAVPLDVNIVVWSAVPQGKGVASSAALEVATMCALLAALGVHDLPGRDVATLCQMVILCGMRSPLLPPELSPGLPRF